MGTFSGHIYLGIFFIFLSLWWLYNIIKNFLKCIKEGRPYRSEASYTSTICGRTIPVESILKTGFSACGFLAECFSNELYFIGEDGQFHNQSGMQHMTIYAMFVIHGVSDLVDHLRLTSLRELNAITAGLAFAWYGAGFYFHSDQSTGKPPLERIIHRLPIPLMFLTSLLCFVEIFKRDSIVIQLVRCYTALTFGTWFTYISFILFSPFPFPGIHSNHAWDVHNMSNTHFMVTAFGIHLILNLLIIMTSFYLAESRGKCLNWISSFKRRKSSVRYEKVKLVDVGAEFHDVEDPLLGEN